MKYYVGDNRIERFKTTEQILSDVLIKRRQDIF